MVAPLKRVKIKDTQKGGGRYFEDPVAVRRHSTGCRLLDRALGGGLVLGRFLNLVGDKSTGKTLLATEIIANFVRQFVNCRVKYRDSEAAFDVPYAERVGLPVDIVDFGDDDYITVKEKGGKKSKMPAPFDTIEDFMRDLSAFLDGKPKDMPGLYILDSLDALSDDAEMARAEGEGTYGTGKAKALSRFFRKVVRRLEKENTTLVIISQTREAIGVTFGDRNTRSGGKALDFYATQIVWLANLGKIKKTKGGIERKIGVRTRANIKKNKAGRPYREADFPILFDFGIDDVWAGLEFLADSGYPDLVGASKEGAHKLVAKLDKMGTAEYRELRKKVNKAVDKAWDAIEESFTPKRSKYG